MFEKEKILTSTFKSFSIAQIKRNKKYVVFFLTYSIK